MIVKVLIFFIISFQIFGNDYHLEDIADTFNINKDILKKLEKNNIKTTIQFLLINKNSALRAKNSKIYKMSLDKLKKLTSLFSLMRIKGVGPTVALLLYEAKIKSLRTLNNSNLKKLEKKLLDINKKLKISPFTPNLKNLVGWQKQITKFNIILK